ncbi:MULTISPECIES: beta-lactamase family protein [unclassified Robiginitalea]|uniref:beta-lactamase family protein n=1 Tax=Robiginitalea TaxID=252306 RepID=UPI002348F76C|nr:MULTISPECIES: beta-lactamase family protein [unclassified Robiginitalea]MDC6355324.1 beta-lactamase family protein [Robiginitalea sp. PM2]MDC6375461.1 beta-lactamase family protein [Robiginitalea sp. SP8]
MPTATSSPSRNRLISFPGSLPALACGILMACACGGPAGNSNDLASSTGLPEGFESKIDQVVADYRDLEIFSGVVLVAREGTPFYEKAFGLADRDRNIPNSPTTLFDIGSMNKTFTSVVVKQLAEEGKLNLSDKLVDYIPGWEDPRASDITLLHLLEHRSGFGDYHSRGYFDLPLEERKLGPIVERAKSTQLLFDPGTGDEYSNLGYVILGGVIEKATGRSYFEEVRERIVEPLGLENTYLTNLDRVADRAAKGYLYTPLGVLEENEAVQDLPNPDGGFLSTARDILTFYHSYYYDTLLLSAKTRETDPFFQYIRELPEGRATGAAGGFEGFNSVFLQVISDDLSILVLANMDEPVAERIGSDILALYRGEEPAKPVLPAVQLVRQNYLEHGVDYVKNHFDSLTVNFHPTDPKDLILNQLGYAFLYGADDPERAAELFRLNTELFPEVANCWDSYGEALRAAGNTEDAMAAYQKALELRPGLESAETALNEMKR